MRILDLRRIDLYEFKRKLKKEKLFPEDAEIRVKKIIDDIYNRGDDALIEYTEKFDRCAISKEEIRVRNDELDMLSNCIDSSFLESIKLSIERVRRFHNHSIPRDWAIIDDLGNVLGQKYTPIENVGIYIPGGKAAYPSTLVMTAVIAHVAGVKNISVITPPGSFEKPSVIAATVKAIGGIKNVYRVGGVQGIAAIAFGTQIVNKVDKIIGPGNLYVAIAKKLLYGIVDIDMIAGPSEVLIIADGSIDINYTAFDLIAQAEHDEAARPICITFDLEYAKELTNRVRELVLDNPRKDIAEKSIQNNGVVYVVEDINDAIDIANTIAPEHLEIQTSNARAIAAKIRNAGAIFIGENSAEAFGDYISGPSHVLPTGGTARFFSPLNLMSFYKVSSVIEMSEKGSSVLGDHAIQIAKKEGLFGHANSINIRRRKNNG